ncbi:integrase family protein [Variovorax guangxiensis]|uniref:tyrosine-type recombinase/integrase n=1 Tax=Variovorax guangxiensis TaxID=1775474 RepID=UPI002861CE5F|nr:integrase family protein [Variovorax guangxiensis]MDR6855318.1 integrase [Variovorax guangxiensis]
MNQQAAPTSTVKRTAAEVLTNSDLQRMKVGQKLSDGHVRPGAGTLKAVKRKAGGSSVVEFRFIWRRAGVEKTMTLGRWSSTGGEGMLSLKEARTKAAQLQDVVTSGQDPAAQRELKREAVRAEQAAALVAVKHGQEKTLQALLDSYVESLKQRGKDGSAYDTANVFLNHCTRPFGDIVGLPASEVTARHIALMLARLVGPGAQTKRGRTALKLRSFLHSAFKLAMGAGTNPMAPDGAADFKIALNPVAQVSPTEMAATFNKAGDRALNAQELRQYVLHVSALPSPLTRAALTLQLASGGQRLQQLLRIESTDVQPDVLRMLDPKGRRKQPRVHLLPIIDEMAEVLASLIELNGAGSLFASRDSVMQAETLSVAVNEISAAITEANPGIPPFRGGDIRRTIETIMAEQLGISQDTRAQLLSHGISGVQAMHYDKGKHLDAKRAALRAWNNYLADLCIGGERGNVVELGAQAA